jgi:hypothetical protein
MAAPQPDLTVELRGPRAATAGNEIGNMLWLVVRNRGTAAAPGNTGSGVPGYRVHLYLSRDRTAAEQGTVAPGGQVRRTVRLDPGRSRRYTPGDRIPRDTPAGRYYLCAVVDPLNRVRELNEHNNTDCSLLHVRPLPSAIAVTNPHLRPPRQLQPESGSILENTDDTISLRWQPQPGARYDLEVECSGCGDGQTPDPDQPETYLAAARLKRPHFTMTFPPGHSGRWRVRTVRGKLKGRWSEWQAFDVRAREP